MPLNTKMDCKPLLNITNGIWAIALYFIWVAQRMYDRHNRRVINEFETIIHELRGEREKEEEEVDLNKRKRDIVEDNNEYFNKDIARKERDAAIQEIIRYRETINKQFEDILETTFRKQERLWNLEEINQQFQTMFAKDRTVTFLKQIFEIDISHFYSQDENEALKFYTDNTYERRFVIRESYDCDWLRPRTWELDVCLAKSNIWRQYHRLITTSFQGSTCDVRTDIVESHDAIHSAKIVITITLVGDWQEEFDEGRKELGAVGMAVYKFFAMFRVKEGHVWFGECIEQEVSPDTAQPLRDYIKAQKEWVRQHGRSLQPKEATRRMWWLLTKLLEQGIFTSSEQRTIMCYYDMTLDLLVELKSKVVPKTQYLVKRYSDHIRNVEHALDRCSFLLTRPDVLEILGSLMKIDKDVAVEIENMSTNDHIDPQTRKLLLSLIAPIGNREPSSSDLLAEVPSQDDEAKVD